MAYNVYYDGFGVLGTLNWDLRWIMKGKHFSEIR